jgi:hypothetical protein
MMAGKNQHVVKAENGWAVKGEGNTKATSLHRTQTEASKVAREIAINQKSELLIHDDKGRITRRNSYGKDPHPPKG